MEKFQELRGIAKSKLKLSDYMLTQTYPSLKDSRLLMVALENLFSSFINAMASILHYEKTFKRIPGFSNNFEHCLEIFSKHCTKKYSLSEDYIKTMRELKEIISERKKSQVEFSRKDSFVICSDDYHIKVVTLEQLKKHLAIAKKFLGDTDKILSQEEDLFR